MANATIDALIAQIEATKGVLDSCDVFINGMAARIQAAVDAAIAGGVSAADMAPVQAEIDSLKAESDKVAAALAANP